MAWGGSLRSCDALLARVERDDPKLTALVILPMKTFGQADAERLSRAIAIGANTSLRSVSASGHHLPPESLKRLGLALSDQAETLSRTIDGGKLSKGISSLAIGSKDMGDEGVIALCEGLERSNGGLLRELDFGWKKLGKDGARAIGRTFASSLWLMSIDLSLNDAIGSDGIAVLAAAAKERAGDGLAAFPSLQKLALSDCKIGPSGVQSLVDMILGPDGARRPAPIHLALGANPIGPDGCAALSKLRDSSISQLQLSGCSVGDEGIEWLSDAATSSLCTGLEVLDLSENSVTEEGAKVFAGSLVGSWPDLAQLKLAKNELGAAGVTAVMVALVGRDEEKIGGQGENRNSTLRNLDLSCTNCGVEGAKAAVMSGGLSTLRLFNNRLGSDGFRSIAPLLQGGHPSIENLDLGGNSADEDAVVALLNAIADKPEGVASNLAVLEIGGNKFGDRAIAALNELKRVWPRLDVAHDKPVGNAND